MNSVERIKSELALSFLGMLDFSAAETEKGADGTYVTVPYRYNRKAETFRVNKKGIARYCEQMPFDKNGRHATGMEIWNPTAARWEDEYEE